MELPSWVASAYIINYTLMAGMMTAAGGDIFHSTFGLTADAYNQGYGQTRLKSLQVFLREMFWQGALDSKGHFGTLRQGYTSRAAAMIASASSQYCGTEDPDNYDTIWNTALAPPRGWLGAYDRAGVGYFVNVVPQRICDGWLPRLVRSLPKDRALWPAAYMTNENPTGIVTSGMTAKQLIAGATFATFMDREHQANVRSDDMFRPYLSADEVWNRRITWHHNDCGTPGIALRTGQGTLVASVPAAGSTVVQKRITFDASFGGDGVSDSVLTACSAWIPDATQDGTVVYLGIQAAQYADISYRLLGTTFFTCSRWIVADAMIGPDLLVAQDSGDMGLGALKSLIGAGDGDSTQGKVEAASSSSPKVVATMDKTTTTTQVEAAASTPE
jgi:hypothetical protein